MTAIVPSPKSLAHVLPLLDMPNVVSYVEPFGGAASVLLNRHPTPLETFNDQRDDVVVFFRSLREDLRNNSKRTIRRIAKCRVMSTFAKASTDAPIKNELEQACRFYIVSRAVTPKGTIGAWDTEKLVMETVDRLRYVQIECISPMRCLSDFDMKDAMFYVRPPTLDDRKARMLMRKLKRMTGRVAVHASPKTNPRIGDHLGDWEIHERTPSDCVWTNYAPVAKRTFFTS